MLARVMAPCALLAACLGAVSCGGSAPAAGPAAAEPAPAAEPTAALPAYLEAFDYVWTTIRATHWDPDKVGPAWDAARDELRPQVVAAKTPGEARGVIEKLLAGLGQSHFGIIPGVVYQEVGEAAEKKDEPRGGAGTTGLSTRLVGGELLVVAVEPGSGAAVAGVKPGAIIRKVGDRDVSQVLAAVAKERAETLMLMAIHQLLSGPEGSTLRLELDTGAKKPATAEVRLGPPPGKPAQFGHLPGLFVDYQSRAAGKDAAVIRLNLFFDPAHVMASFSRDLERFAGRRGLVLDLRGNPGGLGAMAMGMGGHLIDRPGTSLGTMSTRDSTVKFVLNPQPVRFAGKVAILVDELCMSTCEILAGGLQQLGRARVFGVRTPGEALPSTIERLPTGDGFQYAIANYVSADGTPLEGRGVTPDVPVPHDRAALLAGRDPALDAALAWIRE